jgi:hypothetical protein
MTGETDPIEVGEATLATIGLTKVLTGGMPRVGVGVQKEILGLGKRIDDLATDFVYDRLPRNLSMPRPFTYRKLLDTFLAPVPQSVVTDIMRKFPPDATDIALSFQSTLTNVFAHLKDIVPVANYDTYLGPKKIQPTSDKTYEFFLQYWLLDDPLAIFRLMQCGALQPDQVTTFKEFYPSVYEHMKGSILSALVARNLREPSFMNLPPRADRGLATFKMQRVVPYGVNVHDLAPQQAPVAPAQTNMPKLNVGLQTPGQKAAGLG